MKYCFMHIALLVLLLALLIIPSTALADGKVYASGFRPEIPDQRALIVHNGEQQRLLLQSRFAVPQDTPVSAFGWVVPVPENPDFAALDANTANRLFRNLGRVCSPEVTSFVLPLVAILAIIAVIWHWLPSAKSFPDRDSLGNGAVFALLWVMFAACTIGEVPISKDSDMRVKVIKSLQVGDYDAKVLSAQSEADLIAWLEKNGFSYSDNDADAFAGYISKNWLFVTAKITANKNENFAAGGMSPPLLIRFNSTDPVYPLALTATTGWLSEVSLYIVASTMVDTGGRLPLRYARSGRSAWNSVEDMLAEKADLREFFAGFEQSADHLTKYKGKLTAEQMREDLILKPTSVAMPYRESIISPISLFYTGASLAVGILAWLLRFARQPNIKNLPAAYYFLQSMFLSPLVGLILLAKNSNREFLRWQKEQRAADEFIF